MKNTDNDTRPADSAAATGSELNLLREMETEIARLMKRSARKSRARGKEFHFQIEYFHKGKAEALQEVMGFLRNFRSRLKGKPKVDLPTNEQFAACFERRSKEWEEPDAHGKPETITECIAQAFAEIAGDFRAAIPNGEPSDAGGKL